MSTTTSKKAPLESFRLGTVSLSIFENEGNQEGKPQKYLRAKVDKRYFDAKSEEWNSTNSYSVEDLLRLRYLIDQAVGFMSSRPAADGERRH
jgi:hypothetical protein